MKIALCIRPKLLVGVAILAAIAGGTIAAGLWDGFAAPEPPPRRAPQGAAASPTGAAASSASPDYQSRALQMQHGARSFFDLWIAGSR